MRYFSLLERGEIIGEDSFSYVMTDFTCLLTLRSRKEIIIQTIVYNYYRSYTTFLIRGGRILECIFFELDIIQEYFLRHSLESDSDYF